MNDIATTVYKVGSKRVQLEEIHPDRKKGDNIQYRPIDSMEREMEDYLLEEELMDFEE